MATGVQHRIDLAVLVADDDHLILANIADEVVARVLQLTLMAHEVPAPGEDALQLQPVEALIGQHAPVQPTRRGIEQRLDRGLVPGLGNVRPVRHDDLPMEEALAAPDQSEPTPPNPD